VTPHVLVVVANWNGRAHLECCLSSLAHTRYRNHSVVVVDNGSTDDSVSYLETHFPAARAIRLRRNYGFAAANNVALRFAQDRQIPYTFLLNNDTRVDPDCIEALVAEAEKAPDIAICQARQRTWDGQNEVRFQLVPQWAEAVGRIFPVSSPGPSSPTAFASGCAMLLKTSALASIGLLDERYHMYVEDLDLSLRAWLCGFRVMDVSEAVVFHRMRASADRLEPRRVMFWGYRNQLTTILKLYEVRTMRRFWPDISRRWFTTRNRIALRGTVSAIAMLPRTLRLRRVAQSHRRQTDDCFLNL
jgi:GT2 family glycosyltransferase